jgi:hypothetical protein
MGFDFGCRVPDAGQVNSTSLLHSSGSEGSVSSHDIRSRAAGYWQVHARSREKKQNEDGSLLNGV